MEETEKKETEVFSAFHDEYVNPEDIWIALYDALKEEGVPHDDAVDVNYYVALAMAKVERHRMVPIDIFGMLYEDHRNLVEALDKFLKQNDEFQADTMKCLMSRQFLARSHMSIYNDIFYKKNGGNENE